MDVKTNKEYQAMQHEIQAAEQLVRDQEDRLLERMEEQDVLSAELKTAEAALKAAQGEIAGERKVIEDERAVLEQALSETQRRTQRAHSSDHAHRTRPLRTTLQTPQRRRALGSPQRRLHAVQRTGFGRRCSTRSGGWTR